MPFSPSATPMLTKEPTGSPEPSTTATPSKTFAPSADPSSPEIEMPVTMPSGPIPTQGAEKNCLGFERGQEGTTEQEVEFSYTLQTTAFAATFLRDVEMLLLAEVADNVLTCEDAVSRGRLLQDGSDAQIYMVGYLEDGRVSETGKCVVLH